MAQDINRIARERLAGVELARLAPAGFNPTAAHYLIVEAVSLTAALRQRLLAVVQPACAVGLPKADRMPQARAVATAHLLPRGVMDAVEDDDHDWWELARPWRVGPGAMAWARRAIEKLSDKQVVTQVDDLLKRAARARGSEVDVARIAALAAAARALCPDPEPMTPAPEAATPHPEPAAPEPAAVNPEPEAADPEPEAANPEPEAANPGPEAANPEPEAAGGDAGEAKVGDAAEADEARAAGSPSDDDPEEEVDDDPPTRPPDG